MSLFEQGKAIRYEGCEIPLSEVTEELMHDPKSVFPLNYDINELPLEVQGAVMLAPSEIVRLLGLKERKSLFAKIYDFLIGIPR